MKTALITGIRGQDGAYLAKLLLEKGYRVYGADRRSGECENWRLKKLGVLNDTRIVFTDLLELTNVIRTLDRIKPDEIYNLAAQSFVGVSFEQPILTADVNGMGTLRMLEAVRLCCPQARFYQASTSEMFGLVSESPQNEKTPFYPRSPYGTAKLFAHWSAINYREAYKMFNCCGILFNHESPLRGSEFVTRKIASGVAGIVSGKQDVIRLGTLDSFRDWGYAPEYVNAMWLMMQQEKPDDFVIATGESHSVREFAEMAFSFAGIEVSWQGTGNEEKGVDQKTGKTLVELSGEFQRPADVFLLQGDAGKAEKAFGWKPQVKFRELVRIMVSEELLNLKC